MGANHRTQEKPSQPQSPNNKMKRNALKQEDGYRTQFSLP